MGRSIIKLLIISLLVAVGVYFWYDRLEKKILTGIEQPAQSVDGVPAENAKAEPAKIVKKTTEAAESVKANNISKEQKPESLNFQVIIDRNIFQAELETVEAPPEKVVKEVVPTSLDLTLLGTVAGNEQSARAIIIDKKAKKQDIFQIGDAIQGAFIETIERGKVTLDVDGRIETLKIKERKGGGPGAPEIPDMALPQDLVEKPRVRAPRRKPRLRRNRRISKRQDPAAVGIEPEVLPDENLEEIDESGQPEIPPEEELLPPPV